jgi:hypothetical protein
MLSCCMVRTMVVVIVMGDIKNPMTPYFRHINEVGSRFLVTDRTNDYRNLKAHAPTVNNRNFSLPSHPYFILVSYPDPSHSRSAACMHMHALQKLVGHVS